MVVSAPRHDTATIDAIAARANDATVAVLFIRSVVIAAGASLADRYVKN